MVRLSPWLLAIAFPAPCVLGKLASPMAKHGMSAKINTAMNVNDEKEERIARRLLEQGIKQLDENIKPYKILSSKELYEKMTALAAKHHKLVTMTSSQDVYGLPTAGDESDCVFDDSAVGCKNYILTIVDSVAHRSSGPSYKILPEVFLSGALHGNERVGPTSVLTAVELLLEAADCEAKPDISKQPLPSEKDDTEKQQLWADEVRMAENCRKKLMEKMGIDDLNRRWLARLVTTRRIVVVPTANALGYDRNVREEGTIDPNRDFPYDLEDPQKCMQTIAGRTINEIYRQSMFQLSLTFHGGMEVIGYEWGAPTYSKKWSPDDTAQNEIAGGYSRYGGSFGDHSDYNYGDMNDLVYPVKGGMEDWAYAGSWDPDRVIQCQPTQFGGYDKAKTTYNNATLRTFNMLVETSNNKNPRRDVLGSNLDPLNADTAGNGHISRNIRLSLLAIEMVEPYVSIVGADGLALTDDLVPLSRRGLRRCKKTKAISVDHHKKDVIVEWTVGGAMAIDFTTVIYARWDDVPSGIDGFHQPNRGEDGGKSWGDAKHKPLQGKQVEDSRMDGSGRFSKYTAHPKAWNTKSDSEPTLGPLFMMKLDLSTFRPGDQIAVFALATVDSGWTQTHSDTKPDLGPQSHVVNARTNSSWYFESEGKVIQGRTKWYSVPLTINIVAAQDETETVPTVELSRRIPKSRHDSTEILPTKPTEEEHDVNKPGTGGISGGGGGGGDHPTVAPAAKPTGTKPASNTPASEEGTEKQSSSWQIFADDFADKMNLPDSVNPEVAFVGFCVFLFFFTCCCVRCCCGRSRRKGQALATTDLDDELNGHQPYSDNKYTDANVFSTGYSDNFDEAVHEGEAEEAEIEEEEGDVELPDIA